jgi:NADPH-dependent 2,4-dienoyl-CoA reductase/sulfur reductase-like enzyme/nitrite reductase/ring-hydroxylating ferredoxin subunit
MSGNGDLDGPDFSAGISLDDLARNATIAGRVGKEAVLLSKFEDGLFAVGRSCTHYHADLAGGLLSRGTVRCPWHHACFDLRSGRALRAPALDGLDTWQVEVEGNFAFVRRKLEPKMTEQKHAGDARKIVIIGGGAAGLACAYELRQLGYSGALTMISADQDPPVDRPNLSKDYLAGSAPDKWMPLRSEDWYRDHEIDLRLGCEVDRIDAEARRVHTRDGNEVGYDRLLIATGSEPNRLTGHGFDHEAVVTLRSYADARAIAARASVGMTAAVIGSSFIGLEATAALRKRGVEVHVIAPEKLPFERLLGQQVGLFLQVLHERNGVRFHLGTSALRFANGALVLADGQSVAADFVLAGIGVRPRTSLAASAGIEAMASIPVDAFLQTSVPDIFAAGDIAAYPDPLTGEPTRIEHWVVAERQGQVVAANMLGLRKRYQAVPFFWTQQYDVSLRYVGRAASWDEVVIDGDVSSRDFVARYYEKGVHLASAAVGRDREMLEEERRFERMIAEAQSNTSLPREPAAAAGIKCPT